MTRKTETHWGIGHLHFLAEWLTLPERVTRTMATEQQREYLIRTVSHDYIWSLLRLIEQFPVSLSLPLYSQSVLLCRICQPATYQSYFKSRDNLILPLLLSPLPRRSTVHRTRDKWTAASSWTQLRTMNATQNILWLSGCCWWIPG